MTPWEFWRFSQQAIILEVAWITGLPISHKNSIVMHCYRFQFISFFVVLSFCFASNALAQDNSDAVFNGHLDSVSMGAFVGDGKTVATASFDQTATLWDIATQSQIRQYTQHTGPIFSLAVSADGSTMATGGQDNVVRIWDLPSTTPVRSIKPNGTALSTMAIRPDGKAIVSASSDNQLRIIPIDKEDLPTQTRMGHQTAILSTRYSSDGAMFASTDHSGQISLWSTFLDGTQTVMTSHEGAVTDVEFTTGNQQLLTCGDDGVVRLWQVNTVPPQKESLGNQAVVACRISRNQPRALIVTADGAVRLWDVEKNQQERELTKLNFTPRNLALAPNDQWYGVIDEKGDTHLINVADGKTTGVIRGENDIPATIAIHPDSNRFCLGGSKGSIRLFEKNKITEETTEPTAELRSEDDVNFNVSSLLFALDQRHLFCGGNDGKIRQWRIDNGSRARIVDAHTDSNSRTIARLDQTRDSQLLISVGLDQSIRAWRVSDGGSIQKIDSSVPVTAIAISPNSKRIAIAGDDGKIRVLEIASGQLLQILSGHSAPIIAAKYSTDGNSVASIGRDKFVRVSRSSIVNAYQIHEGSIHCITGQLGGSQFLTCGSDGKILLSNVANGAAARQYRILQNGEERKSDSTIEAVYKSIRPTTLALRRDNQRVAVGTIDGDLMIWNSNDGETPIATLSLGQPIIALAFSPDNQKIAVATRESIQIFGPSVQGVQPSSEFVLHQKFASVVPATEIDFANDSQSVWVGLENGELQNWRYAGPGQRRQFNFGGAVYGLDISDNGQFVVGCSADQTIRVFDTTTGQTSAQMRGHSGAVHSVTLSPDETFAVSSGADGTLRLWDIIGGRQLKQLASFEETMYAIAVHPNGRVIAAAGADRKIHLLDMLSGKETKTLEGHTDYIHSVGFHPKNNVFWSYGYAGFLRTWELPSGKLLSEKRIGKVGNHAVASADGSRLLLSNGDGTARVINLPR